MTDPDPLADLAAQLEELRRQWARSQGRDRGSPLEQLKGSTGQLMLLLLEVKRLTERLNDALAKRQLAPPPAPWWCADENEIRSMLAELRHWVEDFARKHYPAYMARLRALLAESSRGGVGAEHAHGRMGARLRRRGQQGPGGRFVVA